MYCARAWSHKCKSQPYFMFCNDTAIFSENSQQIHSSVLSVCLSSVAVTVSIYKGLRICLLKSLFPQHQLDFLLSRICCTNSNSVYFSFSLWIMKSLCCAVKVISFITTFFVVSPLTAFLSYRYWHIHHIRSRFMMLCYRHLHFTYMCVNCKCKLTCAWSTLYWDCMFLQRSC